MPPTYYGWSCSPRKKAECWILVKSCQKVHAPSRLFLRGSNSASIPLPGKLHPPYFGLFYNKIILQGQSRWLGSLEMPLMTVIFKLKAESTHIDLDNSHFLGNRRWQYRRSDRFKSSFWAISDYRIHSPHSSWLNRDLEKPFMTQRFWFLLLGTWWPPSFGLSLAAAPSSSSEKSGNRERRKGTMEWGGGKIKSETW